MSKRKWQRRRIGFLEGFSYDRQATIVTEVGNIDQESFWHLTILWWQKHKRVQKCHWNKTCTIQLCTFRGLRTKINQSDCSITGPLLSHYWIEHWQERSSTITLVLWLTLALNTNNSEQLQNTILLLFSILLAHKFLKNEKCTWINQFIPW